MTSLCLIQFSTYFSTSFISTAIFANWFPILQMSFSYIFFFLLFRFFFACFFLSFPCWWKVIKRTWYFSCLSHLCPVPPFSPETLVKAHFYAAYPLTQTAFWLPLSFPSKPRLPLSVFIWLLLTYTASPLSVPAWPTVLWHCLLVLCQPQENRCLCPFKRGFSQCFTTSVLITIFPYTTSVTRFHLMPKCFFLCVLIIAIFYAEILPDCLICHLFDLFFFFFFQFYFFIIFIIIQNLLLSFSFSFSYLLFL